VKSKQSQIYRHLKGYYCYSMIIAKVALPRLIS